MVSNGVRGHDGGSFSGLDPDIPNYLFGSRRNHVTSLSELGGLSFIVSVMLCFCFLTKCFNSCTYKSSLGGVLQQEMNLRHPLSHPTQNQDNGTYLGRGPVPLLSCQEGQVSRWASSEPQAELPTMGGPPQKEPSFLLLVPDNNNPAIFFSIVEHLSPNVSDQLLFHFCQILQWI